MAKYRIGIDGGGTHCRGRLVDRQGHLLAEFTGGSANVYSHYDSAVAQVEKVVSELFTLANLSTKDYTQSVMVAGLAGANVPTVKQRLTQWQIAGIEHEIVSDVETACFGAHRGQPGAIFICGTGSQGAAWDGKRFRLLGGWGFMVSDLASGAVLGQKALRRSLLVHEGILPASPCMQKVMSHFHDNAEQLLLWSQQAAPKDWARFAKMIFEYAQSDDPHALILVKECAAEAEVMINALLQQTEGEIAMLGGITKPITPWLSATLRHRLSEPKGDALEGALLMAKRRWG